MANAILIDQELWGFFSPANVSVEDIKAAMTHCLPSFAIPVEFLGLDKFPKTA